MIVSVLNAVYDEAPDIDLFGIVVAILFCMQKCGARICRGEIPLKSMQNYATFKKK